MTKMCTSPTQWVESGHTEQTTQSPQTSTEPPRTSPDSLKPDPTLQSASGPRRKYLHALECPEVLPDHTPPDPKPLLHPPTQAPIPLDKLKDMQAFATQS
jgi:hypothetical protein